jgi:hypothetical protein
MHALATGPAMHPHSLHLTDTISLNLDTDLKASDKLLLNTEYYEGSLRLPFEV